MTNAFEMALRICLQKEVVALVDVGFKHSSICVLLNGELSLSRWLGLAETASPPAWPKH